MVTSLYALQNQSWHNCHSDTLKKYFKRPKAATCHSLGQPLIYCQIHTLNNYYKYSFFPLAVVQWNRLSCCLHWLSSVWQSGLLTTNYHNTTGGFFLNLILISSLSTLNTIISSISLPHFYPHYSSFFLHGAQSPAHNPREGVLQYR